MTKRSLALASVLVLLIVVAAAQQVVADTATLVLQPSETKNVDITLNSGDGLAYSFTVYGLEPDSNPSGIVFLIYYPDGSMMMDQSYRQHGTLSFTSYVSGTYSFRYTNAPFGSVRVEVNYSVTQAGVNVPIQATSIIGEMLGPLVGVVVIVLLVVVALVIVVLSRARAHARV